MNSITFKCKTITPMLMHGADGKSAELRPASIKGILRFWWRAIHGNLPLKDLHEQEGEIFGSTDKRSSFSIRINKYENLQIEDKNPLPHKKQGDKGYHLAKALKENQTFQVIISGQNLNLIQNLFILATTLGGFGQRSRRGFGSVQIVGSEVLSSPENIEEFIKRINPQFSYTHHKQKNEEYPYIKKIEIGQNPNKMDELLKKISQATHDNKCGKALFQDERMASPVYVSILQFKEDYRSVITTLNCVSEKYVDFKEMLKRQKAFKEAIL
jgi:CRISPR-associated protein Cmr1